MKNHPPQIELTQGFSAAVDDSDFEYLNQFKWYAHQDGRTIYAVRISQGKKIRMHVAIMNPPGELEVDHIDGDGLNNTRANLRIATRSENARNCKKQTGTSSRFKGVTLHKRSRKWQASIYLRYAGNVYLGSFDSEIEAAKAYDAAAVKHFGEFSALNFQQSA